MFFLSLSAWAWRLQTTATVSSLAGIKRKLEMLARFC
jgi:hypothetical protein